MSAVAWLVRLVAVVRQILPQVLHVLFVWNQPAVRILQSVICVVRFALCLLPVDSVEWSARVPLFSSVITQCQPVCCVFTFMVSCFLLLQWRRVVGGVHNLLIWSTDSLLTNQGMIPQRLFGCAVTFLAMGVTVVSQL